MEIIKYKDLILDYNLEYFDIILGLIKRYKINSLTKLVFLSFIIKQTEYSSTQIKSNSNDKTKFFKEINNFTENITDIKFILFIIYFLIDNKVINNDLLLINDKQKKLNKIKIFDTDYSFMNNRFKKENKSLSNFIEEIKTYTDEEFLGEMLIYV